MRAVIRSTVATSAGVLLVAAAWAAARYYAWEPIGAPRGSWAYTFKVSTDAKQFRLWAPRSAPLYDVVNADGWFARDYSLVRYETGLDLEALRPRIEADGFRCERLGTAVLACDRSRAGKLQAQVSVER